MQKITEEQIKEFLKESNAIEGVYSQEALVDAMLAWVVSLRVGTLTLYDVRKIHENLMYRLNPEIAGCYRKIDVTVSDELMPSHFKVHQLLGQWWDVHAKAKTEHAIKQAHIAFEKVHPFADGNGRTGRIIMNWQRVKAGLPILIIHTGSEQQEYYSWFK